MKAHNPVLALTCIASGPVLANRAVAFDGAEAVSKQKVLGVAQYGAADGESYAVTVMGLAIIETGAAIDLGDDLIVDDDGRAVPATGAEGERVFAEALSVAIDAGKFIEILIRR